VTRNSELKSKKEKRVMKLACEVSIKAVDCAVKIIDIVDVMNTSRMYYRL